MLKLTGGVNGQTIYVAIAHITLIDSDGEGSSIWTIGGTGRLPVKETPEQIMAMEEMVYHLHPAMVISGSSQPIKVDGGYIR